MSRGATRPFLVTSSNAPARKVRDAAAPRANSAPRIGGGTMAEAAQNPA